MPQVALSLRQRRRHARNSFEMLGTVVLVHGANGWLFTNKGGGWEYPAFQAISLVALYLFGDDTMALRPRQRR